MLNSELINENKKGLNPVNIWMKGMENKLIKKNNLNNFLNALPYPYTQSLLLSYKKGTMGYCLTDAKIVLQNANNENVMVIEGKYPDLTRFLCMFNIYNITDLSYNEVNQTFDELVYLHSNNKENQKVNVELNIEYTRPNNPKYNIGEDYDISSNNFTGLSRCISGLVHNRPTYKPVNNKKEELGLEM